MFKRKSVKISIVVPIKNGMDTLPNLIRGISKQTLFEDLEVIAIDSASTDDSVAYLKTFDFVNVVSIDPKTFNHGATRNLGVTYAQGDYVVMTVQDATPTDEKWLTYMFNHFEDKEVVAVCGQQIVRHHKDKNPHQWFRPVSKPSVTTVQFEPNVYQTLPALEQIKSCGWDDVNAMYRKDTLLSMPFQKVMYGEDKLWAKEALSLGYKLVHDKNSQVYHYHHDNSEYTYKRALISLLFTYKIFGYQRLHQYTIKDYLLIVYRNFKWRLPLKWILHNWNILKAQEKASVVFEKALKEHKLDILEKEFNLNIPQGSIK